MRNTFGVLTNELSQLWTALFADIFVFVIRLRSNNSVSPSPPAAHIFPLGCLVMSTVKLWFIMPASIVVTSSKSQPSWDRGNNRKLSLAAANMQVAIIKYLRMFVCVGECIGGVGVGGIYRLWRHCYCCCCYSSHRPLRAPHPLLIVPHAARLLFQQVIYFVIKLAPIRIKICAFTAPPAARRWPAGCVTLFAIKPKCYTCAILKSIRTAAWP